MQQLFQNLLLYSKHFFSAVITSEKLVRHSSYFFWEAISLELLIFWNNNFFRSFRSYCFQKTNVFRAKPLPSSYLLKIDSCSGQLLFRRRRINLFRIKIYNSRATFLKQVLLYSINFSETSCFFSKADSSRRYLLRTAVFSEKLLFGNN